MTRVAHAAAVVVGSLLLLAGAVAGVVNHEVLDSERFAAHVEAVRTDPDVAGHVGVLVTDRLLAEQPDLVAVRPLIESSAVAVVGSPALEPVVRTAIVPLHRALVLGEDDPVVLDLGDTAAEVVGAVSTRTPESAVSVPAHLEVRLSDFGGVEYDAGFVDAVHLVRTLSWLCPLLGLVLLAGAGALTRRDAPVRGAALDVGRGALGAGGALAVLLAVASLVVGRADEESLGGAVRHATWGQLSGAFWVTALLAVVVGVVLVVVAGTPVERVRWARAGAVVAVGVLLVAVVVGTLPGDEDLEIGTAAAAGAGCNGHVELCDRPYDEVVQAGTHNSMAATSEGFLFPEQPDGIVDQLDHGVRVLLVDSWYGRASGRPGVVVTTGQGRADAIEEARATYGEAALRRALRLRGALGLAPRGPAEAYLCHAMCELGATPWATSLSDLRDWLAVHPREVVTLFVQDEVSPEDTADLVEAARLLRYVYTPLGDGAWPTLGQLVESGKRLVVLMENHGGGEDDPWLMQGFDWVTDTPYLFRSPEEFSCAENRGGPDASVFLVNHWISDKRRTVTNSATVNARDVLLPRLEECAAERAMVPTYVAVDFYDRGDLLAVVDELNGVG